MYWTTIYKGMNYGHLKCTRSTRKIGLTMFQSLTKFHDFSRLIFSNSMIFQGFWGFFQIPWIFQVWKKFFFIFQVSMIFPEAGNPVYAQKIQLVIPCTYKCQEGCIQYNSVQHFDMFSKFLGWRFLSRLFLSWKKSGGSLDVWSVLKRKRNRFLYWHLLHLQIIVYCCQWCTIQILES